MLKISKVQRKSLGKELGLEVGDEIVSIGGFPCEDELDYLYALASECFEMEVRDHRTGEIACLQVEKQSGEALGLTFEACDCLKTCHNRCLFCFVDQMPKGLRDSLYVKDDDYAMSCTCGNFVTLTNVSDEQLQRIIRLKLSPLYVSVHTLNPELRVKLLRNRHAGKIVEQIKSLVEGGISLHCQAVIVPFENDGEELAYTARELFKYYPAVRDLACVPTGLTKYREGLHEIPDVDKAYSEKMLDLVDALNAEFGVNFLLPADEYFVKAGRPLKDKEFYGDFSQIENGIGLTTLFLSDANQQLSDLQANGPCVLKKPKTSLLVCGVSAGKVTKSLIERCNAEISGLQAVLLPIENEFFGHSVTCTGLLTGEDIVRSVTEYIQLHGNVDELILPAQTMRETEDVFLCGMTLKQMQKQLKIKKIRVNRDGGAGLIRILAERR